MATDLRELDVEVALKGDGGAEVHVRELLRGSSAIGWRNDLDEVPAAELEARFEESYVSRLVPGARLVSVQLIDRDDPERPLVLDYRFEVSALGRREGKVQHVPAMFLSSLSRSLARTAKRTVPELIGVSTATRATFRYVLPSGASPLGLPASAKAEFAGSRFSSSAKRDGASVVVTRTLQMPVMRILPREYDAFAAFCRDVDLAEATELSVRMP
jgi:hypothetical protein